MLLDINNPIEHENVRVGEKAIVLSWVHNNKFNSAYNE